MNIQSSEGKQDNKGGEGVTKMYPLHFLLPREVRRRLKALKKLQLKTMQLQAKLFEDVHKLDCKYMNHYSELFSKRAGIVRGLVEPEPEDCDWTDGCVSPDDDDEEVKALRDKLSITREVEGGALGVPEFWLTCLKNGELTADMIYSHDEPVLRHLYDIKINLKDSEPMMFTLNFYFSSNPYFNNKVLTKEYELNCTVDEAAPWSFNGPRIVKAIGCRIEWNKGMDVTQKMVQKRQRHKSKMGQVRSVIKTVKNDSFFNFFSPSVADLTGPPGDHFSVMGDYARENLLQMDYEIGVFLLKLVPRAVLYFTGEALDDTPSEQSNSLILNDDGENISEMPDEEMNDVTR